MSNLFRKEKFKINYSQIQEEQLYDDMPKDSDVIDEENRISNMDSKFLSAPVNQINEYVNTYQEIFIIDKLTKYYDDFMAVKGISFGLFNAECFGLLGIFTS